MTDNQARNGNSLIRWWQALSLPRPGDHGAGKSQAMVGQICRDPTDREIWLPAKRRLLSRISDFLIDHDLEITTFTLSVAYDCLTGANPRLAQLVLERTEQTQPITIKWLEEAMRRQSRDGLLDKITSVIGRLRDSIEDFSRTTAGARQATTTYKQALQRHCSDLEEFSTCDAMIDKLAGLARTMMSHAQRMEEELERSNLLAAELTTNLSETQRIAEQDHLTGLPNRRAFDNLFEHEFHAACTAGEPMCIAFVDVDHFKRINDTHGHAAGDRVLKVVAETLARISDSRCYVARHGGEEFAVLFCGRTIDEAYNLLDRARSEMAGRRLVNRATNIPFGQITFSGGIADAVAIGNRFSALKAADEALYLAKSGGRNRIEIANALPPLGEAA